VLSKVYMRLLKLDSWLSDENVELDLPDWVREYAHELLIARWRYLHHFSMVGAAAVDPEYWDREWSDQRPAEDELSEWEEFRKTVTVVARTPGAAEAKHTVSAILR